MQQYLRIIREIVSTERDYVENLQAFNDVYVVSLKKRDIPTKKVFLAEREVGVGYWKSLLSVYTV